MGLHTIAVRGDCATSTENWTDVLSCPSLGAFGANGWDRAACKIREEIRTELQLTWQKGGLRIADEHKHYRRHASVTVYQLRLSFQALLISKPASLRTLRMLRSVNL